MIVPKHVQPNSPFHGSYTMFCSWNLSFLLSGQVKEEEEEDTKILQYCSLDRKQKKSMGEMEQEFLQALQVMKQISSIHSLDFIFLWWLRLVYMVISYRFWLFFFIAFLWFPFLTNRMAFSWLCTTGILLWRKGHNVEWGIW